jgi:hypothetical protein
MGLSEEDFRNKNDQGVVTITVTDGYVEIEEAPAQDDSEGGEN